eukprot:SAG11_NODE_17_length_26125_cov_45.892723_18_plen_113_part_00
MTPKYYHGILLGITELDDITLQVCDLNTYRSNCPSANWAIFLNVVLFFFMRQGLELSVRSYCRAGAEARPKPALPPKAPAPRRPPPCPRSGSGTASVLGAGSILVPYSVVAQ